MSYSFNVKGATVAAALAQVAAEFDKVIANQPIHARDRDAVMANAEAVANLLAVDDTKDVSINCNGSVNWRGETPAEDAPLSHVSVACSASHVVRQ